MTTQIHIPRYQVIRFHHGSPEFRLLCKLFQFSLLMLPSVTVAVHQIYQVYVSFHGKTTSILNHFKSPCRSKRLIVIVSSLVVNLVPPPPPKAHQNSHEEYTEKFPCIVQSTQSAQRVKCNVCLLDFSVTHGGMYDTEWHMNSKFEVNYSMSRHLSQHDQETHWWQVAHTFSCNTQKQQKLHLLLLATFCLL